MNYNMIYNLTDLVMKYSYYCKEFDEYFIKEAYNIILHYNKNLEKSINGELKFFNSFKKTKDGKLIIIGAGYNQINGELKFSPKGMAFNLKGDLGKNAKIEELEYYIYMNLGAIRDIFHELEHVRQANIRLHENTILSNLIKEVGAKKGSFTLDFFTFLKSKGYNEKQIFELSNKLSYNYKFTHDLFPTERSANTKSQKDIYQIAQNISEIAHIENLLPILHKKLHDVTYDGYKFKNGNTIQTPIDLFNSIQTLLGNMYEEFIGMQITGSMINKSNTNEKDIILYGGNIDEEELQKFTK